MMAKLTDDMREAIKQHPGAPVYVVDMETQAKYVLLPEDKYRRVQPLLYDDSEFDPDEYLPLATEAFEEAWNAPGMEQYDNYDFHRPKS